MKKIFLLIISVFVASSCDQIDRPYGEVVGPIDTTVSETILKTVVMEEFTGYRCANCPTAADDMKRLRQLNPGRVELVTIHTGGFAIPYGIYENEKDFRNSTADEISKLYEVNAYPRIAVSRRQFDGQFALPAGKMEDAMKDVLAEEAALGITTEATLVGNTIDISTELKYIIDSSPSDHVVHYVLEDSVVAAQLDDRKKPNTLVVDYIHTNNLRDNVNGNFGVPVSESVIAAGDSITLTDTYNIANEEWDKEQLLILTMVTEGSGGAVRQAYKTKVKVE